MFHVVQAFSTSIDNVENVYDAAYVGFTGQKMQTLELET